MPHFAYCPDGVVLRIERIESACMIDANGSEKESLGQDFLASIYPGTSATDYVMTFYPVGQPDPYPRGKYAAINDIWNGSQFVAPIRPNPIP